MLKHSLLLANLLLHELLVLLPGLVELLLLELPSVGLIVLSGRDKRLAGLLKGIRIGERIAVVDTFAELVERASSCALIFGLLRLHERSESLPGGLLFELALLLSTLLFLLDLLLLLFCLLCVSLSLSAVLEPRNDRASDGNVSH